MNLEQLAVRLRARQGWEAADLGLRLVQAWWRPVYGPWLSLALPAAALLTWFGGVFGLLVFWWLLPLLEITALFALSRSVFGSTPSWKQCLRAWPGLARKAAPELALRRLHPARSLRLSVGQLEGLRGEPWRTRARSLDIPLHSPGLLPAIFLTFEIGALLAAVALAVIMSPGWLGVDWELFFDQYLLGNLPRAVYRGSSLSVAIVVLVLHPFYVAAGFGYYLDHRTRLEGWDLEVAFRRLARRTAAQSSPRETPARGGGSLGAGLVLALMLATASPGHGQPVERAPEADQAEATSIDTSVEMAPAEWTGATEEDPRKVIVEVMTRPELARQEAVFHWQARETNAASIPVLGVVAALLAVVLKPVLWILAAILLWLLLRAAWRAIPDRRAGATPPPTAPPERLLGLDVRPESLPTDVAASAETLWRQGKPVAALSLLYRGALQQLISEGLELRESFTEDDCLRAAQERLAHERASFLARLTRAWQTVAYAHQTPGTDEVSALWTDWPRHFRAPGEAR